MFISDSELWTLELNVFCYIFFQMVGTKTSSAVFKILQ